MIYIIKERFDGKMGTTYGYDSIERVINDCIKMDSDGEEYRIKFD